MKKGMLVAFEGIDGTGKSTQIKLLAEYLEDQNQDVVLTYEPTNGSYGKKIRALFSCRDSISLKEELELFIADRKEHVSECIQPALARGAIVLTDRYYYSTAAYQGAAGADPAEILRKNRFAPVPDLVILLKMDVDASLKRICEQRQDCLNDFEQREQLKKVASLFDSFSDPHIVRIDAAGDISTVQEHIRSAVAKVWARKGEPCDC